MYNIQVIGISEGEKRRDGENICGNDGEEFSKTKDRLTTDCGGSEDIKQDKYFF